MTQPMLDPIENLNFTDSLKAAIRAKDGLGLEMCNHMKDHADFLKQPYHRILSGPVFESRVTEMHVDDNGIVDWIIFDGVKYK